MADDDFTLSEIQLMIGLSNFVNRPDTPEVFKSNHHLACLFESSLSGSPTNNPSTTTRVLISKMERFKFISKDRHGLTFFNEEVFDKFIEDNPFGRAWWEYFDSHTLYLRNK